MKTKTFLLNLMALIVGAAVGFFAGPASAEMAEIPFYAGNQIKPNVMIMLDTSGSMAWDVNGNSSSSRYYLGTNRIEIARHVLTGSGEVHYQFNGYNVWMGDPTGTMKVRSQLSIPPTRILRLNASYVPDPNGAYFAFADADDIGFADFGADGSKRGSNAPVNMDRSIFGIDQFLLEQNKFQINWVTRQNITDGGINKLRDVYEAVTSAGTVDFKTALVQHFWDVQRTVRVFTVAYIASCYYSSGRWRACYRPDAAGSYFVFFDTVDYDVSMSDADAKLWTSDIPLREFLAAKGTSSYKASDRGNLTVCGDSTSSSCPSDGRNEVRTVYMWVPNGTSGATVFVDRDPTENEVRTQLRNAMPRVTLTDVIKPDGRYGPDFTLQQPGNHYLDYGVRMGLKIPQPCNPGDPPSPCDPWDYINSYFTYTVSGKTYHFYDGKDDNNDGKFDGLTYAEQFYEADPGLLDIYTNVRWGLAKFDNSSASGSDSDFIGCGANLLVNLPDEYSDGVSADTARRNVQTQIINMSVSGATPLADSMRNMYEYFFAPANKADLLAPRQDTNPSMYVDHDCDGTRDDHIVQADAAYTSMTIEGHQGCRRNFVIFVTDGDQTQGLGCWGNGCSTTLDCCNLTEVKNHQQYWITQLKNGGDIWQGVKVFLVGFALQGNPVAMEQLAGMALASQMSGDDPYTEPFYANNEEELKATLATIFNIIMSGSYTRSAPAIDVKETATVAGYFTVNPDRVLWEGHLELYDLTQAATPEELGDLVAVADGASVLNQMSSAGRDIFTARPSTSSPTWAFYDNGLSPDWVQWQKLSFDTSNAATLLTNLLPGDQDGDTALNEVNDASVLISFIRATRQDNATFKNGDEREWTLGAINRSLPVIIGPPAGQAAESFKKYDFFLEKYRSRPNLVYVGANDGMFHAFFMDDLNGAQRPAQMEEAFAYIPYEVLDTLKYLRENQWYYVDGSPRAADVFLPEPAWMEVDWGGTEPETFGCDEVDGEHFCWRTMVVCGLGKGGRSYFALDVTDADSTSSTVSSQPAEKIHTFWEFADPGRLGDTWSFPFLAELKMGEGDSTWVAVVFGGGQSEAEEPDVGNYIYFVNADDATILRRFLVPDKDDPHWIDKVNAGLWNDSTLEDSDTLHYFANYNDLPSDPTVVDVPPQEGLSDILYIGDLQGRMWKVNMAAGDTAEWELGLFWDTGDRTGEYEDEEDLPKPGDSDYDEFDALRRPIFYAPTVVNAPEEGRLVIFGTGHIEDKTTARDETSVHCIFAVWDKDPVTKTTGTEDLASYGVLWNDTLREDHCPQCVASIQYPFCFQPGEKIISKPIVDEGLLKFQTFLPYSDNPCSGNYNPCSPGVVRSWYVDYLTFEGILNLSGEGGRYVELEDFTTSRFTMTNKFGDVYMVPPGGLERHQSPANKATDILSWGEGIALDF